MAKKASNPRNSATTSASTTPTNKMVLRLRIKPAQKCTMELTEDENSDKEARPRSAKRVKKTPQKKKKIKVDADKPKKPPTAFFFYLEDFRKGYQEQNPEIKSMRDIGKACGEKWKTMTYEEKVKYYDIASDKRAKFDKAMAEYTRRKESGEDAESKDSESDFDGEY